MVFKCNFSLKIIWRVFNPADAITGCPPNVVICPSSGFEINFDNNFLSLIKAPIGKPPPKALPITNISGTIL